MEKRKTLIRVFKPSYDNQELDAVKEVLNSGWTGSGPKAKEFERAFASYCNADFCIGLNSCTSALDIALTLHGISEGDEVIIPAITFVSAAHRVLAHGAIPIFADVEKDTLNISIENVEKKLSSKTKAVIPVHFAGLPVKMDELVNLLGNIPIIEDCAHAVSSKYKGQHVGTIGATGCFSFHAVKNLAMGEGGALTVKTEQMAERARKLRWFGINQDTWHRSEKGISYKWEYSIDEIGMKAQMDDIHAAIGLVQLKKVDKANQRRQKIVNMYREGLKNIREIEVAPEPNPEFESSNHLFFIKAEHRDGLNHHLAENQICTGLHYKPLHLYDCYGSQPALPVAEQVFQKILTLPLFPDLDDENVFYIIDKIRSFYNG